MVQQNWTLSRYQSQRAGLTSNIRSLRWGFYAKDLGRGLFEVMPNPRMTERFQRKWGIC